MSKNIRTIIFIWAMCLFAIPVYAGEKTQAELLQEMMMNGDMGANTESVVESVIELPMESTSDSVPEDPVSEEPIDADTTATLIELINRIEALDNKDPDTNEIQNLYDMYNRLSDIDKLEIYNIDKLDRLRKAIHSSTTTTTPEPTPTLMAKPNGDQAYNSMQYTFDISGSVTIKVTFTTDENNDGKIDIPSFTLLGPGGLQYLIDSTKLEIKDEGIDMRCSWTDREYVQFDFISATPGIWQFNSNLPCIYEKVRYLGPVTTPAPLSNNDPEDRPSPMPQQNYNRAIIIGIVILIGILLMVGVILVMNKVDVVSKFLGPLRDKSKSDSKPKGKYMNDDDDYGASLSDEEIMAQIKKEYEEQKAKEEKMMEEAKKEQEQEKKNESNELTDDRIYETRFDNDDEDVDEDDELEELESEEIDAKKPKQVRFS